MSRAWLSLSSFVVAAGLVVTAALQVARGHQGFGLALLGAAVVLAVLAARFAPRRD